MAEAIGTDLYLRLREDILTGVFAQQQRLLETSLAEHYQVSRTPVREALAALQQEGLIERTGNGYRVRTGTAEDVIEIYEGRIALEPALTASAARRRTDLDLARLESLHETGWAAPTVVAGHEANAAWHKAVWEAGHNRTISGALDRWAAQLRIYDQGPPAPADDLAITHDEHGEILAAIRAGDSAAAHELMTAHLVRSRNLRLDVLI
ncbi:MAG: GntR family transcriptional regulator [Propionibacteriaceae bacterium]|nr:GntR family transcriptional regulator [Propionibacteriaceae bacterium]